jgi:hypothetical protein
MERAGSGRIASLFRPVERTEARASAAGACPTGLRVVYAERRCMRYIAWLDANALKNEP